MKSWHLIYQETHLYLKKMTMIVMFGENMFNFGSSELTNIAKEKQAIAIHLSLSGRARKSTSELSITDFKSDPNLTNLFENLDRVFLQDENWKCFNAYLAFENLNKSEDKTIDKYLSEFHLKHHKLKEC